MGALSAGMYLNAWQEAVVGRPATSMLSFTPKGMPCRGPLEAGSRLSSTLQRNRELLVPDIHRVQLCKGLASLPVAEESNRESFRFARSKGAGPDLCVMQKWQCGISLPL